MEFPPVEKESRRCLACPPDLQACVSHDFGPNYQNLGIFEHPVAVANVRLTVAQWDPTCEVAFETTAPQVHLWTDGSIIMQPSFWLTAAGYAVVNAQMTCIDSGPVQHLLLTSYTAELFAIMRAVAITGSPVKIFTDSLTIVDLFAQMKVHGRVSPSWSLAPWWSISFRVWQKRRAVHPDPIVLEWQKAHTTCDGIDLHDITEQMAQNFGLTRQQVLCNIVADREAKRAAHAHAVIDQGIFLH